MAMTPLAQKGASAAMRMADLRIFIFRPGVA
jgi:hypothetical protein